jgi:hypothetical protein
MINDDNYKIEKTVEGSSQKVELWSTRRLQFEPKDWMKVMRDDLRISLKELTPEKNGSLYCKFSTSEQNTQFDIENVLLYNVGSGAFSHLINCNVNIERSLDINPLSQKFKNYHVYQYTTAENNVSYWEKVDTVLHWKNLILPSLKDKPHEYWYKVKKLNSIIKYHSIPINTNFGIKINLGVPKGKKVNLAGVCKPILDGVISAFHCYNGSDINEVATRLASLINIEKNEVIDLLQDERYSVFGEREVVRRFQKGIQWNPADDLCYQIELTTYETTGANWLIDGEIYTLNEASN